jgi:hypothetical protein
MFKLITILAAAIPVILFLRTVFVGKSKVMREASSTFKRQIDYLAWTILFLEAAHSSIPSEHRSIPSGDDAAAAAW